MASMLFVSPHPDDAEYGAGGTINRLMRGGHSVMVAVCTGPGDLAKVHSGKTVTYGQRRAEQAASVAEIGSPELVWLNSAPAAKFDEVPIATFVSQFDRLFPRFDEVYVTLPSYNQDHRIVWEAAKTAFRPGKIDNVGLFAYEQLCSNALPPALPEFGRWYVPLEERDVTAKVAALKCHHSQVDGREGTVYGPEEQVGHARMRGMEVGERYAELFFVVRDKGWHRELVLG